MPHSETPHPPIAVVGVSALFPGSLDADGFWRDILEGRDRVTDVPPTHWLIEDYYDPDPAAPDKTYARRGAFLPEVPFDPMQFGVPPSIVPATDSSQLLGLIVAQRVLEDALGTRFQSMDRERVSVILGVTSGQELLASMVSRLQRPVWIKSLREAGIPESKVEEVCERIASHYVPWQESTFPGLLGNVVAGRIANRLDLGGTNCVTDAACASAFSAVSMAVSELYLGESDLVITGGVDTLNDIFMYMCFSKTPALSPTGDCRPFSDQADGTLLGEGLGMVALKRLADAERDGDRVYAVLRGVGSSSDGRAKSVYAPRPEGQAKAIRRAYAVAGYGPETVELVEAHGTATKAGDAAELEGLKLAFAGGDRKQWCALGSIKSQIGHTKAAAGAAGLFKAVMALHHGVLPPTIKVERPNPALGLDDSPFYLNTEARPWVRGGDHPRRASVSSFGFGGSNFHIALEEYRGERRAFRRRAAPDELLIFGADSPAELVRMLRAVEVPAPAAGRPELLGWLARDSQERFASESAARVALVAASDDELRAKLAEAANAIEAHPEQAFSSPKGIHYGTGALQGAVAFLFPGQGSQYLGMGGELAMTYAEALGAWDRAARRSFDGKRLDEVVFPRPVFNHAERAAQREQLLRTEWAQPAIGVTSLSMLALLRRIGLGADLAAGHSFGEVMALAAAGALDEEAAIAIARRRGELMAEAAAHPGAMTAVSAGIERVRQLLADSGAGAVLANHNGPRQVVLSGSLEAIARIEDACADAGLATRRLPVATAFHSAIVADACAPFRGALDELAVAPPSIPVFANSTAAPYPGEPDAMRDLLAEQIAEPVRFVEQIEAMYAAGARVFVEVGPGAVLTGLVGDILAGREHLAVALDRKGKRGLSSWHDALGRLAAAGVALDLAPLWEAYARREDPRSLAAPKMTLRLTGSNYGKPYPPPEGAAALPPPNPEPTLSPTPPAAHVPEVPVNDSHSHNGANGANGQSHFPVAHAEPRYVAADPWVAAYQEAQRQTAEAHTAFQNAMAQAHMAYLQTAESAFDGLVAMATGVTPQASRAREAYVPQRISAPQPLVQPMPQPIAQRIAQPMLQPIAQPMPQPMAQPMPQPIAQPAPAPEPAVSAPQPAAAPPLDAEAMMLEVVAEKTGYPAEMLSMDMALEADLGIDSIKRVEILSEMMKRRPDLPKVDTKKMASLNTLGEIASYMSEHLNGAGGAPSEETARPKASSAVTP